LVLIGGRLFRSETALAAISSRFSAVSSHFS